MKLFINHPENGKFEVYVPTTCLKIAAEIIRSQAKPLITYLHEHLDDKFCRMPSACFSPLEKRKSPSMKAISTKPFNSVFLRMYPTPSNHG